MIYRFGITTTIAYNTEEKKLTTELKLGKGVIHQLDVVFPSGCQAYLHVKINHGLHQVWPTNPDEDFASDGEPISFKEAYELRHEPYILTVYTWNLDEKYPHDVIIRIGLLPRKTIFRRLF